MKMTLLLMTALVVAVASVAAGTILWPVGPAGTGSQTRTLWTSFGDFNPNWDNVGTDSCNFHIGIDILPYDNNMDVRAAKDGYFKHIVSVEVVPGAYQWWAVIVDDYNNSEYGWGYQHLTDPTVYGWSAVPGSPPIMQNDLIAEMSSVPGDPHLHFHWVPENGSTLGGSDVNPLDSLINASNLSWEWNRGDFSDVLLFIPDVNIQSWPDHSSNLDTLDRNSLYGVVDILYGYCLEALGDIGNSSYLWHVTPQKMKWTLSRLTQSGPVHEFDRYVVDFSDQLGAWPGDNEKYQQHFFRLSDYKEAGISSVPAGRIVCLTNCADDTTGFNEIDNIQENSWPTNLHSSGSGIAPLPEEAMYPDGAYGIEVTSYAWDGTDHEVTTEVVVDNFIPHIEEIIVYSFDFQPPIIAEVIYEEYWSVDGSIRTRDSVETGYLDDMSSGLGIAVKYSETMDTNALSHFYFTGEIGGVTYYSSENDRRRWLRPVDNFPANLGISDTEYWRCYETPPGVDCGIQALGCIGRLSFHVSDAQDLSGNTLDHDPGTIAGPRDPETGEHDYSQVEEGPYNTASWGVPSYTRIEPGVFVGMVLGTNFRVILEIDGAVVGDCPHWCGFWLERSKELPTSPLMADVVKPDGSLLSATLFEGGDCTSSIWSSALTADTLSLPGRYGWFIWETVTVDSVQTGPDTKVPVYHQHFRVTGIDAENGCDTLTHDLDTGDSFFVQAGMLWFSNADFINTDNADGSVDIERSYLYWPDTTYVIDTVHIAPPLTMDLDSIAFDLSDEDSEETAQAVPDVYSINPIRPNPCSGSASIRFSLAETGPIYITVYDMAGRAVAVLADGIMNAGSHDLVWDLRRGSGTSVPSGLYFVRMTSGDFTGVSGLLVVRR